MDFLSNTFEKNTTQSFISCIANVYFDAIENNNDPVKLYSKPHKRKNLAKFKGIVVSNLTFDKFCMANYGNLINLFSNDNIEVNPEIKKLTIKLRTFFFYFDF